MNFTSFTTLCVAAASLCILSPSVFADDVGQGPRFGSKAMAPHMAMMPGLHLGFGMGCADSMINTGNTNTGSKIRQAVLNGDFVAFQALHPHKSQRSGSNMQITRAQFDKMTTHARRQQTACKALQSNDYAAFVATMTPSQAQFADMVKDYQTQKSIQSAIQSKDYVAFQKATVGTPMANITLKQFEKLSDKKNQSSHKAFKKQYKKHQQTKQGRAQN